MTTPMTSTSSTPFAYGAQVDNAASAHPTLRLSLPASFLDAPQTQSHACQPVVLVRVPPGLFIDPYAFPTSQHPPSVADDHFVKSAEAHADVLHLPTYALTEGRDVIQGVQLLNGTEATAYALDHDFSTVELEKGTGYSLTSDQRAKAGMGSSAATRHNADRLVREYTAAIVTLYRVRVPEIVPDDNGGETNGGKLAVKPEAQQVDIRIPLHTRYPIPVGTPVANAFADVDWSAIGESLVLPERGSYSTVLLEYPHAFWSCRGDGLLAVDSGVYGPTTAADLLAPMHGHLALPSSIHSASRHLYLLLPPFGTSREPFRLRVPVGRAELGLATQLLTLFSLLIAALLIVRRTSSAFKNVQRSESDRR